MAFDTVTFWIFFAIAWPAWRFLPFGLAKSATLLLSLVFYAWWDVWYLSLIGGSAVVDYLAGARIFASDDPRTRRRWLSLSLVCNLGLLGAFKYGHFAVQNLASIGSLFGVEADWNFARWAIPVGISFYTFQTLSYSIDIYRRNLQPAATFRDFFLYVAFFPQLVAGPIVRARDLLPQFSRRRRLLGPAVQTGVYYIIVGLFLKMVIADNLDAPIARAYDVEALRTMSPVGAWLGVIYFHAQVYADFAGYSSVAIGLAYLMGLRFPPNFNYPFIARTTSELWTRWHMSLSGWLRDYVYITLGGNRYGLPRTLIALFLTMLIGGLWHGASWSFVVWGALHGALMCIERLLGLRTNPNPGPPASAAAFLGRLLQIAWTVTFFTITMALFRGTSFEMSWLFFERMFAAPFEVEMGWDELGQARHLVLVGAIYVTHLGQLLHEWYGLAKSPYLRAAAAGTLLFLLLVVSRTGTRDFIYFQF